MSALSDAIAELNAAQLQAFEVRGHCVVEAPPGSGKTKLLVTKMASDLETQIKQPHGAACITLTNAAAIEVHERFSALSSDSRSNLFIGTVHAFALNKVVRPFARVMREDWLATVKVLSAAESDRVWESSLDSENVYDSTERRLLKSTVARYRSLMLPESVWKKVDPVLYSARAAYLVELAAMERIDFGGIIEKAVAFAEGSSIVREALRAAYSRIYVDEYQDLAPGLDRVIRALCFHEESDTSTLFAVGDADQAIYGWTGTNSRLLREVASLPRVSRVILDMNYRSGLAIVEASRRLFDGGPVPKTLRRGGEMAVTKVAGSIAGQAEWVALKVLELQNAGIPLDEVGVLCRTNAMANDVSERMESLGVPSWVKISEDWESPLSLLLERCCAWAACGRDASGFTLASLLAEARRTIPSVTEEALGAVASRVLAAKPSDSAVDLIGELRDSLEANADAELRVFLAQELDLYLAELLSGSLSSMTVQEIGRRRITDGRAYVTTLSSSKGLEFDFVFIVDLEDGRLPFFTSFDDPEQLEEERNKFYVGITRARHGVSLLWSGYTPTRFGNRQSTLSRFVLDLDLRA